jgi:hypothetical protein
MEKYVYWKVYFLQMEELYSTAWSDSPDEWCDHLYTL